MMAGTRDGFYPNPKVLMLELSKSVLENTSLMKPLRKDSKLLKTLNFIKSLPKSKNSQTKINLLFSNSL